MVLTGPLRKWNPRPACGTAFSSVHNISRVCFCLFCALSVFLWASVSKNSHLKLICLVSVSSVLFQSSCGPWCQKTLLKLVCFVVCSFCLLVGLGVKKFPSFCVCLFSAFSVFLLALVSINCLFCALSVFLWALVSKNSHLKLVCFVSVSSVLFLSSCGPWCQKTLV